MYKSKFQLCFILRILSTTCLSAILLVACSNDDDEIDLLLLLSETKSFVFEVKLVGTNPFLKYPYEEQHESNYIEVSDEFKHNIIFSEDGDIVTIERNFYIRDTGEADTTEQDFIEGQLFSETIDSAEYLFEGERWVGGRFVVWIENESFHAEITHYGSGLPVVSSERGSLVPAE